MTETLLAEGAIEVGHHETAKWLGLTVNVDTVASAALAAVIVIALAFFLRAKVTSTGVPITAVMDRKFRSRPLSR